MKATKTSLGMPQSGPKMLLKDRAYHELKTQILNDRYPPGTFLAERSLAADLGMSKTPIKAALERLELEGYVVISPQQCILVRDLSPQEVAEQYEIRTALETYIVSNIAGKLSSEQQQAIGQQLESQKQVVHQGSIAEQVKLDAEFHMLLAEQLGNETILRVLGDLQDRIQRVITRAFRLSADRFQSSFNEHVEISEAIFGGHASKAAMLISRHLERGRKIDML